MGPVIEIELDTVKCDSCFRESAVAGANQAPPAGCLHHQPRSLKHEVVILRLIIRKQSTFF